MSGGDGTVLLIGHSRLGDIILSSGLIGELARRHGGRVVMAAGASAQSLFERHPDIAEYWPVNKRPGGGHLTELWQRAASRRWEAICDLKGSALPFLLRTHRRYRYVKPRPGDRRHKVEIMSSVIGSPALGPDLSQLDWPEIRLPQTGTDGTLSVAIGATAAWPAKIWPVERWAEVHARIQSALGRPVRFVLFGAPGEEQIVTGLVRELGPAALDLVGRHSVVETGALMRACALFAGNDSGLMHLAAAAGIPTLGLFGHTDPAEYGPWGALTAAVEPEGLLRTKRRENILPDEAATMIRKIEPSQVSAAMMSLIGEHAS